MKTTFVLTVGLFLLFVSAHAQNHPLPGYIVRVSGDSIHGFLKEQGTDESSRQISFKKTADDKEYQIYTPVEVKAFQYDGGNLFRAIGYSDNRGSVASYRTNFARLLVTGEYDLYSFTEKDILLFLARKDSSFYLIFDDDIDQVPIIPGNFRNELNFFALSCDELKGQIDKVNYTPVDVTEFFKKVDVCVSPTKSVTSYYHKPKGKLSFYANAGGISLGSRYEYSLDLGLRLTWPQLSPGVSLNAGIRYAYVQSRIADPNYLLTTIWHKDTYKLKSLPVFIQYNFTRGIVQPFILAGLSLLTMDNVTDLQKTGSDAYYHRIGPAILVGGGVEVRLLRTLRARAEWRYEYMSQYPTVGLAVILP